MKVADLLETRRENWRELERACYSMDGRRLKKIGAANVQRFAALYRAACADLALADAYQLPPNTVHYLHQLVGRAHNQLYPSRSFVMAEWGREMLYDLPQRLFRDNCLRLAFVVFWGVFLACMLSAYFSPKFSDAVVGKDGKEQMEQAYEEPLSRDDANERTGMAGFYVLHNAGIGLQCFGAGLLFGVGGLFTTISNAAQLGTVFGHMATVPQRVNFFQFVTAHGPFELTGIVLGAAAGMRLGFSIIDTGGFTRAASLRRASREAMPAACASVILFCLAAVIEAFISPSSLPYAFKAFVAVLTSAMLLFYFVMLGYPRESA
ncbi:MAG TPA: stage II sporulation protein M [Pirellulales bacterium]|nr:stage II sporulation protein M [Pirellulales bacterium]